MARRGTSRDIVPDRPSAGAFWRRLLADGIGIGQGPEPGGAGPTSASGASPTGADGARAQRSWGGISRTLATSSRCTTASTGR
jgi:hypothetical protein